MTPAEAAGDCRITVEFPPLITLPALRLEYLVTRGIADTCQRSLRAECPDAVVVVDDGPVAGRRRFPCERLWLIGIAV